MLVALTAKSPLSVWPSDRQLRRRCPRPARTGRRELERQRRGADLEGLVDRAAGRVHAARGALPLSETPGIATATVPCTWPASPVVVRMNAALPFETLTTPPSESATLLAATFTVGHVVAARDLVGAEVGRLLEREVAGEPLAEDVDREAGALEAQVRAGGAGRRRR